MTKLKSILLVTTGIIIGASAISVLNAQSNAPYFEVAASTLLIRPVTKPVALTRFAMPSRRAAAN